MKFSRVMSHRMKQRDWKLRVENLEIELMHFNLRDGTCFLGLFGPKPQADVPST